jgi:membrane-associated phospholipid phosphatase
VARACSVFCTTAILAAAPAHADALESAGEILRYALPVAAGGLSMAKDDTDGLVQLGLSEAASLGVSFVLQEAIPSERPDGSDVRSFPSDSAAMSFSAAAYLHDRYGWRYGAPAYAVAAFVGYTRVAADRHHWHDVAAGALIGWGASMLIVSPYTEGMNLSLAAGYAGAPLGAQLRLRW